MEPVPARLRVKRRREVAAASEIIVETSSKPAAQDELAASLQQSLVVSQPDRSKLSATENPSKKRCRYVLLCAADTQEQQQSLPEGPVLELWHISGVTASIHDESTVLPTVQSDCEPSTSVLHGASVEEPPGNPSAARALQHASVYADMLQEYLTENHDNLVTEGHQQQRPYRRPSRRRHISCGEQPSLSSQLHTCQDQQQSQLQQDQCFNLPTYMTLRMLQQHGLVDDLQHPQTDSITGNDTLGLAAAAPADSHMTADDERSGHEDEQYTYDTYVFAAHAGGCGWDPYTTDRVKTGTAPADLEDPPVVQVPEDDLVQLHHEWLLDQAAAADAQSEDSNAEDYFGNDYPEEEDSDECERSDDSSDLDHEQAGPRQYLDNREGLGVYRLDSSNNKTCRRLERECAADAYCSDGSYDVNEYSSSADEAASQDVEFGPAWLRKHCVAYGSDDAGNLTAGAAWRMQLAQQFAPQQ